MSWDIVLFSSRQTINSVVAVIMGLSRDGFAFLQIVFGSIERTSS
jgi:hypothetical protein